MLTMAPPLACSFMTRAAACATRKTPLRLVSTTRSQSVSAISRNGMVTVMPALLTRISSVPSCAVACATAEATDDESVTSMATATASPPAPRISSRTCCR